jgi:dephospho-CoA kinase
MRHLIEKLEDVMKPSDLIEGINDPYIFKALFTAGGPGSGKSFVADHTVKGLGLKLVNSDVLFEKLLKKKKLTMKIAEPGTELYAKQMKQRGIAKKKTSGREAMWIDGMLGLMIDGTGKDYAKISKHAKVLKANGYDVGMIFVNTSLDTALARNAARARSVDENLVKKMWSQVQSNIGKFQKFFGPKNFFIIDSNETFKGADADAFGMGLRRIGLKWLSKPIQNPVGNEIVNQLIKTGGKTLKDLEQAQMIAASKYDDFIGNCLMERE